MAFVYWIHLPEHTDMFSQGYIGITSKTVTGRYKQHKARSLRGCKRHLYNAIRKHGDSLVVDTIIEGSFDYCKDVEFKLRPTIDIGYNHGVGGVTPNLGRKLSDETKAKIGASKLGKSLTFSEEHCRNLSIANTGKVQSESAKQKIREKATGRIKTKESIAKFSEAMSGRNLWENSAARKDLWAIAYEFKALVDEFPKISARKIALKLGYDCCNPWKLVDKIKAGWNPSEDSKYLAWLEEYKTKQGEPDGT